MELYTKIAFPPFESAIDYDTKIIFAGSCFSENIGNWLRDMKFDVQSNICGITYNPNSIAKHIIRSLNDHLITESDLVQSREKYAHPDFHSGFNHANPKIAVKAMNHSIQELGGKLRSSTYLFLTFGTSIAFELKSTKEIVNNCHHLPASYFNKRMLEEGEMLVTLNQSIEQLLSINPNLKIVLTVSPIRHLRHCAIENNRSKSRLIRLCETLEHKHSQIKYFPVYEYVMDELRDYRFYRQDDLIHLNDLGISLIRERFTDSFISKTSLPLMARIRKWKAMKAHKILNPNSSETTEFLQKLKLEEEELEKLLGGRFQS